MHVDAHASAKVPTSSRHTGPRLLKPDGSAVSRSFFRNRRSDGHALDLVVTVCAGRCGRARNPRWPNMIRPKMADVANQPRW